MVIDQDFQLKGLQHDILIVMVLRLSTCMIPGRSCSLGVYTGNSMSVVCLVFNWRLALNPYSVLTTGLSGDPGFTPGGEALLLLTECQSPVAYFNYQKW